MGNSRACDAGLGQVEFRAHKDGRHDQQQPDQQGGVITDDGFHLPVDGDFLDGQVDAQGDADSPDHQGDQGEDHATDGQVVPHEKRHDGDHHALKGQDALIKVGSRLDPKEISTDSRTRAKRVSTGWIILETPA